MALGISLNRERIDQRRSRNLLWMFYVTTPIGILLGTWWSGLLEDRNAIILEAVFDARSRNVFLHCCRGHLGRRIERIASAVALSTDCVGLFCHGCDCGLVLAAKGEAEF